MEAQEQAKQLDSVTDVFQEQEVDATKAQEAMSALSTPNDDGTVGADHAAVAVSPEDVQLIVTELEVTEETAEMALRDVAGDLKEGETMLVAALRKLVTA